jgi:hypothetical protein
MLFSKFKFIIRILKIQTLNKFSVDGNLLPRIRFFITPTNIF